MSDSPAQPTRAAILQLALDRLGPGQLAELRRGPLAEIPHSPTFWTLAFHLHLIPDEDTPHLTHRARPWALTLHLMALGVRHSAQASLGYAMAQAGWSELRFTKLMRASPDQLPDQLISLARYLKSRDQHADVDQIISLILTPPEHDYAERLRLRIARDYYRALHHQEKTSE